VQLVQNDSRHYRLQGSHRLQITDEWGDVEKRFLAIEKLLQRLAVSNS
jgi:transcription-repair coupling factor (superfamily II helicase)